MSISTAARLHTLLPRLTLSLQGFLCFEHLTLCPIQRSLIDASLLTEAERTWLNEYHEETLQKVGPPLEKAGDERGLAWLKRHCEERV